MATLCYSVRLVSLVSISDKACKAVAFDGSEAIIPKSQIFGIDQSVSKSDAYWISAWILDKKDLQYSSKKEAWFDENKAMLPSYTVERHFPEKVSPIVSNKINELLR